MILAEFEKLVQTPADVERLNAAILELAVRGKLGTHNPNDESATALLARIRAEKTRLEAAGEIRPANPLAKVKPEEMPFDLPEGWVWCRLGDVADYGQSQKASNEAITEETWVLDLADIESGTSRLLEKVRYRDREFKSSKNAFASGDVLYGKLRPYLDKVLVADEFGVCTTEIIPIRPFLVDVNSYFLRLVMKSPYFLGYVNSRTYGMRMPRLGTADGQTAPIPLPPLAEQKRIVERVDGLLARTAALKESLAAAEVERAALTGAALHRLESAADPAQASAAWALIRENFAALIDTPQSVAGLKQTILQLAVQGKLVAQDGADEPAAALLARIRAEKARLEATGEIRTAKPLAKVKPEEMPFDLPEGWVWVRLGEIAQIGTGATPLRSEGKYYENGDVPWITSSATNNLFIDCPSEFVTQLALRETNLTVYPSHTLIIAMYGQGKTRGQVSELLIEAATNQACAAVVFAGESKSIRAYAKLFFIRNYEYIRRLAEGGAQPNLNLGKITNTEIPLPPLAEQQRIVERVDALFALCAGLAAELSATEETRARWVAAVLAGV